MDTYTQMMQEIAEYEAEIDRVYQEYWAPQPPCETGWTEPRRARRIRERQRKRKQVERLTRIIWQGALGRDQIFAKSSEQMQVYSGRRKTGYWVMSMRVAPAYRESMTDAQPSLPPSQSLQQDVAET